MKRKSHLAAAAIISILASHTFASADNSGGGTSSGGGTEASQSYMQFLQENAADKNRTLDTIKNNGQTQPRSAGPRTARTDTAAQAHRGREQRTAGGSIYYPRSETETLLPPGKWGPPAGWSSRFTADNGWTIYFYPNGSKVAVGPDGSMRF